MCSTDLDESRQTQNMWHELNRPLYALFDGHTCQLNLRVQREASVCHTDVNKTFNASIRHFLLFLDECRVTPPVAHCMNSHPGQKRFHAYLACENIDQTQWNQILLHLARNKN